MVNGVLYPEGVLYGSLIICGTVNDKYKGSYDFIPTTDEIIIPTKEKVVSDDITIRPVPYREEINEFDGINIYIGEEV